MATTDGNPRDALMQRLQREATRFDYFQVVRLLRLLGVQVGCAAPAPHLRTRAALQLGIAAGEVSSVRRAGAGQWRVTAHCFGLYGATSPLPLYYTEDLLDEQREGRRAARGLIDILHHALYPLLFESWEKYRVAQRVAETGDEAALGCLHAFAGLGPQALYQRRADGRLALLRYLALLQQGPRSAAGLQGMLGLELRPASVRVVQHVRRMLPIPCRQRTRVGECCHALGVQARMGSHIDDACATIAIQVRDLDTETFQDLLPGRPGRRRMQDLVSLYLRDSLDVRLELQLRADARPPALRLGEPKWARIGLDAWLDRPAGCAPPAHVGKWQSQQAPEPAR